MNVTTQKKTATSSLRIQKKIHMLQLNWKAYYGIDGNKTFPKTLLVNKIHQEALKKSSLKAILEITFRERNLFEKIDDVTTNWWKETESRWKFPILIQVIDSEDRSSST